MPTSLRLKNAGLIALVAILTVLATASIAIATMSLQTAYADTTEATAPTEKLSEKVYTKSSYTDVPAKHWGLKYIEAAKGYGLMTGDSNGQTFRPDANMTRAEAVVALWKANGKPQFNGTSFTDITADWYYTAICWGEQRGIITGYLDANKYPIFEPDNLVTREQFAAMLYRYASIMGQNVEDISGSPLDSMPDANKVSSWALKELKWCMKNGIIEGVGGKTISPQQNITRAEVATMLVRAKEGGWLEFKLNW